MNMSWLIIVTILMPVLGAVLLLLKPYRADRTTVRILTGSTVVGTLCLTIAVALLSEPEIRIFELLPNVPLYFRVDSVGKFFSLLTVAMWTCSTLFSFEYMNHQEKEERYSTFSLFALGSLLGACYSGNLVTTYVFYEMMTLSTFPLVMHEQKRESISAGLTYLYYSLAGAFLGLIGIFFLYADSAETTRTGGRLAYVAGGFLKENMSGSQTSTLLVIVFLMLVGIGSKVGMFPLHGWLPKAHPVAPASASALLSGNITKIGILFILRVVYYSVGASFLNGTWVQYALLSLALLTIFLGSMLAFREKVFKKRLAYSTVSQTSYILTGLYLFVPMAATGALMHVLFHSIIKNLLFLCAGAVIYKTGKTKVEELKGIGRQMPVTMWCFTFGALALVGIPPFSAFVSKWYLAVGALETDTGVFRYLVPVILLISALLTAGYLLTITADAFFRPRQDGEEPENVTGTEGTFRMLIPVLLLAGAALVFGIVTSPLTDFLESIVSTIL